MFLELRHLRTLAAVAELESLAAAAERLHLTQSALSHQIKAIESYYEVTLFTRKTRPMQFTPAGKKLLALAREILPQVDRVDGDLRRQAGGTVGRLHIALECHSCYAWMLPVLERFRRDWPDVEIDLSLSHRFDAVTALQRGQVDAVVSSDPPADDSVAAGSLFRYEVVLALPNGHPLTGREFIRPADLVDQTLVTYPVERDRLDIFSRFLDPAGMAPAGVRQSEMTALIAHLVAVGQGVAALPAWAVADEVSRGLIQKRRLGRKGLYGTLYLLNRHEDAGLSFHQAFLGICRNLGRSALDEVSDPLAGAA
ncbi:MAG: LysR substrate-binding domain-containing protein [Halothiobacillaceae bacterium]